MVVRVRVSHGAKVLNATKLRYEETQAEHETVKETATEELTDSGSLGFHARNDSSLALYQKRREILIVVIGVSKK